MFDDLLFFISLFVSFSTVITNYYIIARNKKQIKMYNEDEQKKIIVNQIREYIESEEFKEQITNAINNSEVNKKIDKLIIILCTNVPELRRSRICNE
jgi:ankyrin repeat protein